LVSLNADKQNKMKMLEDVQRRIYSADQKMEEARSRKHNVMERLEQLQTVEARLGTKQRQLHNLERDKLDPELERAKCRNEAQVHYQATSHYLHLQGYAINQAVSCHLIINITEAQFNPDSVCLVIHCG
jgi:DNA repair exonuclease SbcCD ATPase subunit